MQASKLWRAVCREPGIRLVVWWVLALVALRSNVVAPVWATPSQTPVAPQASTALATPSPPPLQVHTGEVAPGETAYALLRQAGLSPADVLALRQAARSLYDVQHLRVGQRYRIEVSPENGVQRFVYEIDTERQLEVERQGEDWVAHLRPLVYQTRQRVVTGTISESLYTALTAQGETPGLVADLADIFAWDVDFHRDLRPGDAFRLLVEERARPGGDYRYHRILAAELVNGGRVLQAVYYPPEGKEGAYYWPDGRPMRRMFLRSPLRYTRITSRFSYRRFHPILKRYRPHLGIDYAAPVGTPVRSVGDGVVVWAGRKGGNGKMVQVRHNQVYSTYYLHLSRFAPGIRPGVRVHQGQVIGYVGATGLATGPHLCFRLTKNGKYLNPVRLTNIQAPPLPEAELPAFRAYAAQLLAKLAAPDTVP